MMVMRLLLIVALMVLSWLQYGLWFGDSGHFAQQNLQRELERSRTRTAELAQSNARLIAEVVELKKDDGTVIESRAREFLGYVKPGEVFYLVPDP